MHLDSGNYKGTYKLIGGEICFDFTNTISWRETDHPHEWFDIEENLAQWAQITGILDCNQSRQLLHSTKDFNNELEQLKKTRLFLYNLFNSQITQGFISNDALHKLSLLTQKANSHQILSPSPSGYIWSWQQGIKPSELILFSVLKSASDVLTRGDLSRIKKCPSCQWLFLDTSKNKRRRWCTMEDCGNRHKVNAFNKRNKSK
ncbi:CGNR zinc finger domain-containing protein [Chondrinema litorale]|uniref:CGNR zinc finger domain-containing protein n=1 Tax=Chondrinema litorale TaxID=2994555 RepID=UPI002542757D|nr:CGNR zinc finger domain-containing protein [Chondrinema litorale]UZR98437.1 CGNR zinc finger domain-containing protein [Chondrinema litorale]